MKPSRTRRRPPAIGLVGAGAVSVQFGAALATKLFGRVGPAGAVTLRLVAAAVVLMAATALTARQSGTRRTATRRTATDRTATQQNATQQTATQQTGTATSGPPGLSPTDRMVVVGFGLVLAVMNLCFYEAIARIPLGVAVTLEFSGPLALALVGSRRWADGLWAAGAGAGVALLATGIGRHLNATGVVFALVAGMCWVAYILLSKETGQRFDSLGGLAGAMAIGAAVLLPFGLAAGGTRLFHPSVLGLGAAVGVMSSVIPYSLELIALRQVTPRAFGVMMSLDPALATAAGFAVLGQQLDGREWVALALVVGANLGNALGGSGEIPPVTTGTS